MTLVRSRDELKARLEKKLEQINQRIKKITDSGDATPYTTQLATLDGLRIGFMESIREINLWEEFDNRIAELQAAAQKPENQNRPIELIRPVDNVE